jgi:hypothetical protein
VSNSRATQRVEKDAELLRAATVIMEQFNNKEPAKIEELLKTAVVKELKRHPASKLVNQAGNNRDDETGGWRSSAGKSNRGFEA